MHKVTSLCKDGAILACQLHPTAGRHRVDRNALRCDDATVASPFAIVDHSHLLTASGPARVLASEDIANSFDIRSRIKPVDQVAEV